MTWGPVRQPGLAVLIGAASLVPGARAQQPTAAPPPQIAPYRAPVIALVQPADGGTVPQDKPVVVFRFAPGEAGDPLDAASFRAAVDGIDQTHRFQLAASEAWGALGPPVPDEPIVTGVHRLAARICSTRGACGETAATVTVLPPLTPIDSNPGKPSRRERVLDALLAAVRKLLSSP